jgi:hypothetical protein
VAVELSNSSVTGDVQHFTATVQLAFPDRSMTAMLDGQLLRSFFLPEDELWFCIYEADSSDEVAEASRRAQLVVSRIQLPLWGEKSKP